MELFERAAKRERQLRGRLDGLEGKWTDVLHQNRKLVKEYIEAHQAVRQWEELLALPETF
jgi:hypothetical protein